MNKRRLLSCICPSGCPVYTKYKLKDTFYCMYGKAK
nr:DUF2769 domain-containing protein [Methanocella conradii]